MAASALHSRNDAKFVEERLKMTEQEEEFSVFKQCFDEVIERLPACGPLLARIKAEYELVLCEVERSSQEVETLTQRLHVKTMETSTIRNYYHQEKELEVKIATITASNTRIENEIERMRNERDVLLREEERKRELQKQQKPRMTSAKRRSLRLSIEEATNIIQLQKELQKAKQELEEAQEVTQKKYVPVQKKQSLQTQLKEKEELIRKISAQNQTLNGILKRMNIALQETKTYNGLVRRHQVDPSEIDVADFILENIRKQTGQDTEELSDGESEDPLKEREAEMILDCFEKFNELFESEDYEEAALHAATSPRGVLRTPETLQKFKSVSQIQSRSGKKPPLVSYCEALMQSAAAYRAVSLHEALECVHCMLEQGESFRLAHWITQDLLPSSVEIGTQIFQHCKCGIRCTCGIKNLAFTVFKKCGAHQQAALCLVYQGRFTAFLALAQKLKFGKEDYTSMLYTAPSLGFARCLVTPPNPYSQYLTVFEAMHLLLRGRIPKEAAMLLEDYLKQEKLSYTQAVMNDTKTSWDIWQSLFHCLQEAGLEELAVELFSLLTVRITLNQAIENLHQELTSLPVHRHEGASSHSMGDMESGSHLTSMTSGSISGSGYSSNSEKTDDLSSEESSDAEL